MDEKQSDRQIRVNAHDYAAMQTDLENFGDTVDTLMSANRSLASEITSARKTIEEQDNKLKELDRFTAERDAARKHLNEAKYFSEQIRAAFNSYRKNRRYESKRQADGKNIAHFCEIIAKL